MRESYIGESHRDGVIDGFKEEVRTEAIKWLKRVNSMDTPFFDKLRCDECNNSIALWIKHFFNVDDEELR
ncbi:hypothetical protein MUP35_01885 [Patescibacteria group bacterium]|nr:hypothetical protein [Patescibacteria group bacterium]